ncbi:MAG: hypothetical protein FJ386_15085 [Verrucomicrobia bacterium]|nr:hypothetical protein [Verrucomicrobiota bacterium]
MDWRADAAIQREARHPGGITMSDEAVATRPGISPNTVATHKRRAFAKLGAHNLAAARSRWAAPTRAES